MARLRYPFVLVTLLSWVAFYWLEHDPRFALWSLCLSLGCSLASIVLALVALSRRNWPAFAAFSLPIAGLIVGYCAWFSYRLNYVCAPGDHIIQSDADAIKQAQMRIIRARYLSHGVPGYVDEKPGYADFTRTDCCRVERSTTIFGVIIWNVELEGKTIDEPRQRHVSATMMLSNCGTVFDDESFIAAEPTR
jgi:hypothetical protein